LAGAWANGFPRVNHPLAPFTVRRRNSPYNLHMTFPALKLDDLSPDEKLRLLEQVWDSLAADPDSVPLQGWQLRELDRRLDELDREGPIGIPWERVLSEIEGRSR
jgi:putative addiction module component (TIGR02574 family)